MLIYIVTKTDLGAELLDKAGADLRLSTDAI